MVVVVVEGVGEINGMTKGVGEKLKLFFFFFFFFFFFSSSSSF